MIKKFEEFVNETRNVVVKEIEIANMMFVCGLFMSDFEYETYCRSSRGENPMLCIYFYPGNIKDLLGETYLFDKTYNEEISIERINEIELYIMPAEKDITKRFRVAFNYENDGNVEHINAKDVDSFVDISGRMQKRLKSYKLKTKFEDSEEYMGGYSEEEILDIIKEDNIFTDNSSIWATKDENGYIVFHINGEPYGKELIIYPFLENIEEMFLFKENKIRKRRIH